MDGERERGGEDGRGGDRDRQGWAERQRQTGIDRKTETCTCQGSQSLSDFSSVVVLFDTSLCF